METKQQKDNAEFEFWKTMFRYRTITWKKKTLARLRKDHDPIFGKDTRVHKINALESLLS